MPTSSKSTVYNTLNKFVNARLINEITIDDLEVRYEYTEKQHGHFKCSACGKIYDFNIDILHVPVTGLNDFQINDQNVYFTGICKSYFKIKK